MTKYLYFISLKDGNIYIHSYINYKMCIYTSTKNKLAEWCQQDDRLGSSWPFFQEKNTPIQQ